MLISPLIENKRQMHKSKQDAYVHNVTKLPMGSLINHHFRNRMLIGRLSESPYMDQAKTFLHVSF